MGLSSNIASRESSRPVARAWMAFIAVLVTALFAGCGAISPAPSAPPVSRLSGGLLVVRLQSRFEPPTQIAVDVASAGRTESTAFAGKLQRSLPGHHADYLVALALPPSRYVLTGVREGTTSGGVLAALATEIEVAPGDPAYLGRLVISADAKAEAAGAAAGLRIEDQYDEDTLLFRTSIAGLKTATIGRNVISAQALAAASNLPEAPGASAHRLDLALVTPSAEAQLAAPARGAFARFLRTKLPRAFATNEAGDQGSANGPNAVDRALRACAKQAGARGCRIFAVDDTLMAPDSCRASVVGTRADAPIEPGCASPAMRSAAARAPAPSP